jgi:hypothetical protein
MKVEIKNGDQIGYKYLPVRLYSPEHIQKTIKAYQEVIKSVTKDCSTLPIAQGRSYTATLKMLGNAQVFPIQFFFIENSPIFSGLYQIMKVRHSISPNFFCLLYIT